MSLVSKRTANPCSVCKIMICKYWLWTNFFPLLLVLLLTTKDVCKIYRVNNNNIFKIKLSISMKWSHEPTNPFVFRIFTSWGSSSLSSINGKRSIDAISTTSFFRVTVISIHRALVVHCQSCRFLGNYRRTRICRHTKQRFRSYVREDSSRTSTRRRTVQATAMLFSQQV